jgi:hypothetical protein
MSKYLNTPDIEDLIEHRDKIFAEHKAAYQKHTIDILANDTLSALSMWEIVSQYDPNYNINFHRNGEDAKSLDVIIEQKCSTVKPSKKKDTVGKSGWQFHAPGVLEYPRYIFGVRRKDNLQLVRLWDINSPTAIQVVKNCLLEQRQQWIDKGKPYHDGIVVPEKLLLELVPTETITINNCLVTKL